VDFDDIDRMVARLDRSAGATAVERAVALERGQDNWADRVDHVLQHATRWHKELPG